MARDDTLFESNRRTWLKTIGALGTTTSFAGCIGGGDGGNGSGNRSNNGTRVTNQGKWPNLGGKEVHYVADEPADAAKEFYSRVASDFEQATGANVRLEYVGTGTSSVQRVVQLMQAGNPPELFRMSIVNATNFHSNDLLVPVDDVFDKVTERIGTPSDSATLKINNKQWYIPFWFNNVCYYYRNDVSEAPVPNTWQKELEYAKKIDQGDNNLRGSYIPAGTGAHVCYRLIAYLYARNGKLVEWNNDKIKVAYNDGKERDKLVEVMKHLKERKKYSAVASDSTYTTWTNAIPSEISASTSYVGFRPVIQAARNKKAFSNSIKAIPGMPKPPGGSNRTVAAGGGIGTFKGSNVKAAKSFINFMLRSKYLIDIYMNLAPVHNVPAYPGIRKSKRYQQALSGLSDAWPDDTITTYQEETDFITRPNRLQPPNPYASASTNSPPVWNMQVELLVDDKEPEAVIEKYAPEHQKVIDEVQE